MPRPQAAEAVLRARRRRQARTTHRLRRQARPAYRLRRLVALLTVAAAAALTIGLAVGAGDSRSVVRASAPAPAERLLPSGPPSAQVVAQIGSLHLQMPVPQPRVTAVGYRRGSDGALGLDPVGLQANAGLITRMLRKLVGGGSSKLRWYQLAGSSTTALDIGAAPGTDVYAPVDGTVVAMTPFVLDGRTYGVRLDVQPSSAPSIVVSLTHLRADPALTVGSSVAATTTRLGTVLDLAGVEKQALARYTQDAGNHVAIEVHPAATLALR